MPPTEALLESLDKRRESDLVDILCKHFLYPFPVSLPRCMMILSCPTNRIATCGASYDWPHANSTWFWLHGKVWILVVSMRHIYQSSLEFLATACMHILTLFIWSILSYYVTNFIIIKHSFANSALGHLISSWMSRSPSVRSAIWPILTQESILPCISFHVKCAGPCDRWFSGWAWHLLP